MKAIIVSSTFAHSERIELLKDVYERKGYDTTVVMTDFMHTGKKYVQDKKEGYLYIKTKPYYRNISPQRLYSRYRFAKDAFHKVREMEVDLLHVLIPANSLAKEADAYKKAHPNVKLYIDIIDLWPESLPITKFKHTFPFRIWKNLRDAHLDNAEKVYFECDLFRQVLGMTNHEHSKTLYWAKRGDIIESHPQISEGCIHLCYLGSMNYIIDIDYIIELCNEMKKHKNVKLHLIGDGEQKERFLQLLEENKICVCDYGTVYDDEKKQKIFDQCHFGLNIMKPLVCVGLTMKSLDYFKGQLPIINNIKGDTTTFVENYDIGFNGYEDYLKVIDKMSTEDYLQMRRNVRKLYEEMFTKEAFFRQIQS